MKKLKPIFRTMLFVYTLIWIIPAHALEPNWYSVGLQAESSGNMAYAIEAYKKSATEQGLKDAKFALGRIYQKVYANDLESFKWYSEAAEQGDTFAQYEIGLIYLNGSNATPIDVQKAKDWLQSAASNGNHGDAAFKLFQLSSTNQEASKWLTLAAEQGVYDAMKTLADAYSKGLYGLAPDNNKSQLWLDKARLIEE